MKRLLLSLLFATGAYGQTFYHYENILLNQNGTPISGVSVFVCAGQANPIFTNNPPCTLQTVYSDPAGAFPITQPILTSGGSAPGNYGFWSLPGTVTLALSGVGIANTVDILTLPVTASGNTVFTGAPTFSSINKIIHVNSTGNFNTIASALAACPTAPTGCHIIVDDGTSLLAVPSFTLGVSPCQNSFAQVLELGVNTSIAMSGTINLLCAGYIYGENRDGAVIIAGGSFPTSTPMIDMGDNVNLINARVEGVKVNCNLVAGCTGIRGRGLNENSLIGRNVIQNYLANGILLVGSTINTANFKVQENQVLGGSGASDAIVATDVQAVTFERNTEAANGNFQISAVGLKINGTVNTSANIVNGNHGERHTDEVSVDGKQNVIIIGASSTNGLINTVHVQSTATGSVWVPDAQNNANGACPGVSCVIKNDVTNTQLAATNPPAPFGVILDYRWQAGLLESWNDALGPHIGLGPIASGTKAVLSGTGACATITTQTGGAWAGSAKCTGTTGASTLTITFANTAPNGWTCDVWDETTRANVFQQTSHTQTSCVETITSVTQNDVFVFKAVAF